MTETQQVMGEHAPSADGGESKPQSPWSAVAPLVAWWWLVIAIAAALILGFGFLHLIQLFANPLGVLVLSTAIAASLSPLVAKMQHFMPRAVAVILVYLILILLLVFAVWGALPLIVDQLQSFGDDAPQLLEPVEAWITKWAATDGNSLIQTMTSLLGSGAFRVISLPITIGESILQILLIIFVSFYALIVGPNLQRFVLSLVPVRRNQQTARLLHDMNEAMGGYVRGVALSSVLVGVFAYLGLYFLGVEYPLLLAILAAVMEILPILGTLISTIVIVVVALFQSPQLGLLTLAYMLALQQIEGNIIFPTVMSSQTNISPLLSIFAFFAGGVVGGLLGAVIAIPLAAALRVVVIQLVAPMVRRWTGAESHSDAPQDRQEAHVTP